MLKPGYLPASWDINHAFERQFGDYSVYRRHERRGQAGQQEEGEEMDGEEGDGSACEGDAELADEAAGCNGLLD